MNLKYFYELVINNIDSINISLITGFISGWIVVILDTSYKEVQLSRERFALNKYRRYQIQLAKKNALSRYIDLISMLTDENSKLLLLNDLKSEISTLLDDNLPYRYFNESYGYLSEEMSEVSKTQAQLDKQLREIGYKKDPIEINIDELIKLKQNYFKVGFELLKNKREHIKFEVLKHIFRTRKYIVFLIMSIIFLFILG